MKHLHLLGILALLGLSLVACGTGDTSAPEVKAEMPVAVQAVLEENLAEPEMAMFIVNSAAPTSTVEPARERPHRSYPAPTGYPGFRLYYQKRCYPGCHYDSTAPGPDDVKATQTPEASITDQERPYRSYPAPTGYAGFRRYYQKRCYPGCHYDSTAPGPDDVKGTQTPEASIADQERPYRSYPAPTGYPGFRRYYQKRCYPGCHYDSSMPVPTKIHP